MNTTMPGKRDSWLMPRKLLSKSPYNREFLPIAAEASRTTPLLDSDPNSTTAHNQNRIRQTQIAP